MSLFNVAGCGQAGRLFVPGQPLVGVVPLFSYDVFDQVQVKE